MSDVKKKARGRPPIYESQHLMVRGSFRIPKAIVETLKQAGNGNVCQGIIVLAKMYETKKD